MMGNNTVSSPESPLASNKILKKAEKRISYHHDWLTGHQIHLSVSCCCISSHKGYNINIYTQRTTKLLTPIIKPFASLKVLIQNERTDSLRLELYAAYLYRLLWEIDTLPPFFYYELLILQNIMVFVKYISYNECYTVFISFKLTMYIAVNPLSMGFLYHQAETKNISKFTCHFVFLLLTNPSLVEEPSWKSKTSLHLVNHLP